MKAKHLFLVVAVLVAAGGLWLGGRWTTSRAFHKSSIGGDGDKPRQMLRPPNPNRKFEKLTPEERVQLARRGPIGG